MTASQCGIPLFTPSHGNSMSGMDQFLSSATCLGDLLKESGYQLNYMGGADLNFAGKGKLYKTHGFTNIQGRDELVENLKDSSYKTSWGLYDDSLFEMVFNRYIKLSESNEKFGLFTLTLDTHHPKGHPSKSCDNIKYKDGSNPILNAVACSDYLISNFINKVIESPHASNTIIVLASDHLAMRNTAFDLLRSKKNRRNLFMIIDPSKIEFNEIKTLGSSLDIGTTLLPFLGFDGDINLGRNLLNSKELEKERSFIHSQLRTWRPLISEFWDFPKITNSLTVDIQNEQMSIDNRTFRIPAYIELNNELQSTLKFQFNTPSSAKSLLDYRKKIDNNKSFILIDECKNARNLSKTLGKKGFCLLAGKGSKYTKMLKLNTNITYSVDEIEKLIKLTQKTN